MHSSKPRISAQGKALMPILVGLLTLCVSIVSEPIVPNETVLASDQTLHAAARRTVVTPKKTAPLIPVVDQEDIRPNQRILADRVLRALPSFCRDNLQNFYVRYDAANKSRGLGGASTIIVTGRVPDREFMALIVHECGHVTDLGGIEGTADAGTTNFYDGSTPIYANDPSIQFYTISWNSASERKTSAKNADFVSGYAASDPFEDFAEAFAFYALQGQEFARLAKSNAALRAKYEFMQNVVFRDTETIARGSFKRGNQVPWDVTKLPYTWHAKR